MSKNEKSTKIITIVSTSLVAVLDEIVPEENYQSRSDLIRDVLRRFATQWLKAKELSGGTDANADASGKDPDACTGPGSAGRSPRNEASYARQNPNSVDKGKRHQMG